MAKHKALFIYLLLFAIMVLGISITTYPHIMQQVYRNKAHRINMEFRQTAQLSEETDIENLKLRMLEYNRELFRTNQSKLTNAQAYETVDFDLGECGFEGGMAAYISIPVMDVELPIFLGATKENMDKGAVLLSQTSLPVGGVNTNAVIAAHRGAATAAMFRDIELLSIGDSVYISNYFEELEYRVVETEIISPDDLDAVLIQPGKDLLTLITCHPYRFNYQRYLVYAERVEGNEG